MKIYYARTELPDRESARSHALELLPESRLKKLSRMKSKESKKQCIAAGLLLEYGLRQYDICGKDMTFLQNSDGKPYLLEWPKLHYNLSHSGEYAALAIGSFPVGIDIEKLRYGQEKLVKRFFSQEEVEGLLGNFTDSAFTRTWTRKEAFLKACGTGMRMPLEGFSTMTDVIQINEKMPAEMRRNYMVHYVKSYQINDEYWLSVCQEGREVDGMPEEVVLGELL